VNDILTLVIPTHERAALLDKVLRYYAPLGLTTLVVDSSAEAYAKAGDFPTLRYVHRPGEPFPHKLRAPVLEHVRTPFMFFCPDDMFMSPEALDRCLAHLRANPACSSAQGLYFGMPMDGDRAGLRAMYVNRDNFDMPIDAEAPEQRMVQLFLSYIPTFYAVYRTDCWKNQLSLFPDAIRNYVLAEFFFALCTAIHGGHTVLPVTYALTYLAPTVGGLDPVFRNDLHELATMERYAGEYAAFERAVLDYLVSASGLSERRARLYLTKAVALQAWKRKPLLTPGGKVRRELALLRDKLLHRDELARRKKARRQNEAKFLEDERDAMLAAVGPEGRVILDRIWTQANAL
jgi:glycosyltransferase domain-containing protein